MCWYVFCQKKCISSSVWHFVNFRDLTTVWLIDIQCTHSVRYRPTLAADDKVCLHCLSRVVYVFRLYYFLQRCCSIAKWPTLIVITLNHWSECECCTETVLSLTSLKLISVEIIQENRFVVKTSQNNWGLTLAQFRDDHFHCQTYRPSKYIFFKWWWGPQMSRGPGKPPPHSDRPED